MDRQGTHSATRCIASNNEQRLPFGAMGIFCPLADVTYGWFGANVSSFILDTCGTSGFSSTIF